MPSLGVKRGLRTFDTARSFVSILREVSLDEIKEDALLAPLLAVVAPTEAQARRVATALVGPAHAATVAARAADGPLADLARYDAVVAFDPKGAPATEGVRRAVSGGPVEPLVVAHPGSEPDDPSAADWVRSQLMDRLAHRATAFGRAYPPFRAPAANVVVNQTARTNAQFALASNIPAVIPIVGSFIAAGADFFVLTKNQVLMVFKVAAIHGRDLDDRSAILREMLPVVGAGIGWRTVAREAASFLPLAAGTIPKVAIAYGGTQVAGRAADFYYSWGKKPSREQVVEFYRQAAEAVRFLPLPSGDEKEEPPAPPRGRIEEVPAPPAGPPQAPSPGGTGDHPA